jgi:hypothetical protein
MINISNQVDDHGWVADIVNVLVQERVCDQQPCVKTSTALHNQGKHQILRVDLCVCFHLRKVVNII